MHCLRSVTKVGTPEEYVALVKHWAGNYRRDVKKIPACSSEHLAKDHPPLVARLSAGTWVVLCECGEGAMVTPGWPMMCAACLNEAAGHRWRRVAWPADDVKAEVEGLLEERPQAHQHWHPQLGDTPKSLRQENRYRPWDPNPPLVRDVDVEV